MNTVEYVHNVEDLLTEHEGIRYTEDPNVLIKIYDILGLPHLHYDLNSVAFSEGLMIPMRETENYTKIHEMLDRYKRSENTHCNICMDESESYLVMCSDNNACDKLVCSDCVGKLVGMNGMNVLCPFCRMPFAGSYTKEYDDIILNYGLMMNMIVDLSMADGFMLAVAVDVEFPDGDHAVLVRVGHEYNAWIGRFYEVCARMMETGARVRVCGSRMMEYVF